MKAAVEKQIAHLEKMVITAERLADSTNPDTATRYEQAIDSLEAAIAALQEIPALFDN
jgi:hypothetical protein